MKDLDEFLPNIRPFAPGVPDLVAYEYIRQAAIEFCEKTRLWRYDDVFTLSAENPEAVIAPSGAVIHEIERIDFNDQQLTKATPAQLDEWLPLWRAGTLDGNPQYFTQTEPNTVALVPLGDGELKVWVWLKPAQDAEEVPDFMVDQYRQIIADGALTRILMIPGQSFTNAEMAMAFSAAFQEKLGKLFTKGITGQQRARPRAKGSFF